MVIKRKKVSLLIWAALLLLWAMLIAGCSASKGSVAGDYQAAPPGESEWRESENHSITEGDAPGEEDSAGSPRYVIRKGSLSLTVSNTRKAVETIEQMTADSGGIVSESQIYEFREGHHAADLTLRVPENQFDSFISRLQELGEAAHVQKKQ